MQEREPVWDANGANPRDMEASVVEELVTYDLAKRNELGQAQLMDGVLHDDVMQDLAFQRDGTPRTW